MTPTQQRQIEACTSRAKTLRISGFEGDSLRFELRREGWPEAAIIEAMEKSDER